MSNVTVIGCGYVGTVTAAGLASLGHDVVGVDRLEALVFELNSGQTRLLEPDLPMLLKEGLASRKLRFDTSYESVADSDFVFLCVDTPQTPSGAANLSSVRSAVRSIAKVLNGRDPIIVNKSTSPVGTGDTIDAILKRELGNHRPRIVANPEFLREGSAVQDFMCPSRIVVGGFPADTTRVAELYSGIDGDPEIVEVPDTKTAELIKYASNAYLATRVSYINEIANLCGGLGIPIAEIVRGIGFDPRIGSHFLSAGIGYGGSCLPKDVAALRYTGFVNGVATPLLSAVEEVNAGQRTQVVRRLRAIMGPLDGRRLAVWGVSFKAGIRDARESPAVEVIDLLLNEGAEVTIFDPESPPNAPDFVRARYCETALDACREAEALLILTDWAIFHEWEWSAEEVIDVMSGADHVLFDGRNLLNPTLMRSYGFTYLGVGQ